MSPPRRQNCNCNTSKRMKREVTGPSIHVYSSFNKLATTQKGWAFCFLQIESQIFFVCDLSKVVEFNQRIQDRAPQGTGA